MCVSTKDIMLTHTVDKKNVSKIHVSKDNVEITYNKISDRNERR